MLVNQSSFSTVIDDLLDTFKQRPNDEAFAYFYCERTQSDRQEPDLISSSFVRQHLHSSTLPFGKPQAYEATNTGVPPFITGPLPTVHTTTMLFKFHLYIYPPTSHSAYHNSNIQVSPKSTEKWTLCFKLDDYHHAQGHGFYCHLVLRE